MPKVTVFAFISLGTAAEEGHAPRHVKATREAIAKLPGATAIESSAEEIEESALDDEGCYYPERKEE